jgi:hypothetical protein
LKYPISGHQIRYPAGYRIFKKAGYPANRISGASRLFKVNALRARLRNRFPLSILNCSVQESDPSSPFVSAPLILIRRFLNMEPCLGAVKHYFINCDCQIVNFLKYGMKQLVCPTALHTVANISMRNFPISLIFLVSGILFF